MARAITQSSILFVCLGNICRSPLAEGIFRAVVEERGRSSCFFVDSAGTGSWHAGSAPDPRSTAVAARYGIDISRQTCRKITGIDFKRFDFIFGMDQGNVGDLLKLAPPHDRAKIHLFLEYALGAPVAVPDPYYGGPDGFETVYRMIREGSEALISKL